MKWFRHDTDMHKNRKITKLIRVHGATGYAFWCILLEKLYAEEDSFQICADELWFEDIAENLKLGDYRTPIRVLDTLAELGLIDKQLWQEHVIASPSITKRGDSYIVKRTKEAEKKQRYRMKIKAMSTVDSRWTEGQCPQMSTPDPDTYSDPNTDPESDLQNKISPDHGRNEKRDEVPSTYGKEGLNPGDGVAKREKKKGRERKPCEYSEEFLDWWRKYYEFCQAISSDVKLVSPGSKREAFAAWQKLFSSGAPAIFFQGDEFYRQSKMAEFRAKGEAREVSHGCRYLGNGDDDPKWKQAYDFKQRKGSPAAASGMTPEIERKIKEAQAIGAKIGRTVALHEGLVDRCLVDGRVAHFNDLDGLIAWWKILLAVQEAGL